MSDQFPPAGQQPGLPQPPSMPPLPPMGAPRPAGPFNPGFGPAVRTGGTPIMAPSATEPDRIIGLRPSVSRGLLFGLVAAAVGGAIWFGFVVATDRQSFYIAVILGLAIGYATSAGLGKGGVVTAAISAVIAGIGVILAYYYIDRHFIIKAIEDQGGRARPLSLIPTYTDLKDVLRVGFEADGMQYLFSLLCIGGAGFFGFKGVQQSQRFGGR